jgi:hypothetical protein
LLDGLEVLVIIEERDMLLELDATIQGVVEGFLVEMAHSFLLTSWLPAWLLRSLLLCSAFTTEFVALQYFQTRGKCTTIVELHVQVGTFILDATSLTVVTICLIAQHMAPLNSTPHLSCFPDVSLFIVRYSSLSFQLVNMCRYFSQP